MTSSALNTHWRLKRVFGHGLINQTGSAGPHRRHFLSNISLVLALAVLVSCLTWPRG